MCRGLAWVELVGLHNIRALYSLGVDMTELSWDHEVRGHLKAQGRGPSARSVSRALCSSNTELFGVSRKALEERRSEVSSAQGSRHDRGESRVRQSSAESRRGIPGSCGVTLRDSWELKALCADRPISGKEQRLDPGQLLFSHPKRKDRPTGT